MIESKIIYTLKDSEGNINDYIVPASMRNNHIYGDTSLEFEENKETNHLILTQIQSGEYWICDEDDPESEGYYDEYYFTHDEDLGEIVGKTYKND